MAGTFGIRLSCRGLISSNGDAKSIATIAEEAKKGYDAFIIGLETTSKRSADFDSGVANLAKGFDGPLIIAATRDDLQKNPNSKFSVLVPVNGTEPSRRAAEVAITLARATKAPITVLYVAVRTAAQRACEGELETAATKRRS